MRYSTRMRIIVKRVTEVKPEGLVAEAADNTTMSLERLELALGENGPGRILQRGTVHLDGAELPIGASVTLTEGRFLQRIISRVKPTQMLEVGLAFGISALFAELALAANGLPYRHIVIDPLQSSFEEAGLRLLAETGYRDAVEFHDRGSEFALPALAHEGRKIDLAFIDGWHTFDHTLVDFFYVNRMLKVGGVIVFDDANWPSVARVLSHALSYPCYRLLHSAGRGWHRRIAAAVGTASLAALRPSIVAIEKIAEDERSWTWHSRF